MKFAVVFPGQGSQAVGMLAALSDASPVVRETFKTASSVLGYDLWQLVTNGPKEKLGATERTQPALVAAGIAIWRIWGQRGGGAPTLLAGHSLGEYTALVAAGSIDFEDAVRLVEYRGQAMQTAVPAGTGAMAAILGLDDDAVRAACARAREQTGDIVAAANFNAAGQVVISGASTAVAAAVEAAKAAGAKRALPLPVSVPSHCDLMRPAADKLAVKLNAVTIQAPRLPVIHNCDVTIKSNPDAIRKALIDQLYHPVRWVDTVRALRAQGIERLLEFGPGKVLTGLTKRIDKGLSAAAVNEPTAMDTELNTTGDNS